MAASAFTTVSARQRLAPPLPQELPPPKPTQKKTYWPQPVRDYVQRCFNPENDVPDVDREEVEMKLKQIITEAAEKDLLESVDWANLLYPQQMIANEKKASPTYAPAPSTLPDRTQNQADITSKKRTSSELVSSNDDGATPPWRKQDNPLEDRITRKGQSQSSKADKRQKKSRDHFHGTGTSKFHGDLEKRKQRFDLGKSGNLSPSTHHSSRDDISMTDADDNRNGPVIGTCQKLEKNYFRLTSAPKPETVRPLPVLENALELLKTRWRKENNYGYVCDQFKSLRQDLTVQHIKNEFTVTVYEIHARIALEKGDLGEYNQCQTQLRALYALNLGGHPAEFLAYRILYLIHTCNRTDMNEVLANLTAADKQQGPVKHALEVRSSLALGNYHKFFRLYLDTPNMGGYLMDMFVTRERLAALVTICKAYKPDVKIRFLTEELGFESDQDCVQFMCDHGAQALLEGKDGVALFSTLKGGPLFEAAKGAAFRKVDIKGQI